MAHTSEQLAAKVDEVYELVNKSATPISTFALVSTQLRPDWTTDEIEQIGSGVIELLIHHGWKKLSSLLLATSIWQSLEFWTVPSFVGLL
jgi:hypothetical protein